MLKNLVIKGDCLDILPHLLAEYGSRLVIISDPPYGGNYATDYNRSLRDSKRSMVRDKPRNAWKPIEGDKTPFDPTPFLEFPKVVLWGYQHFAARVTGGNILVWVKREEAELGSILSDAELAWEKGTDANTGGVFAYNQRWRGFLRAGEERGQNSLHPTQKPVGLMRWCITRQALPKDTVILDPYCGSGSTLVAAVQLGFSCIGIELMAEYVKTARERLNAAISQPDLWEERI